MPELATSPDTESRLPNARDHGYPSRPWLVLGNTAVTLRLLGTSLMDMSLGKSFQTSMEI